MGKSTFAWVEPFALVEQGPGPSPWLVAHHALSRLAKQRAAADMEEGRCLLAAWRSAVHVHLGFGSFAEYVERYFGYQPRSTQEKLRVARALEGLPMLTQALEQGTHHWSAVRELTRVAVPENERAWLDVAQGKSVRQLEELVAGRLPGDDPTSPAQPVAQRHVLRFEVSAETYALFREAIAALRRSTSAGFDDDSVLLALARIALGGPSDDARASYQIAVTLCAQCGRGHQLSNGELVAIDPNIVAMARCDAQELGAIPPVAANDALPPCGHDRNIDARVGADAPANNDFSHSHTNTRSRAAGGRQSRAKQSIPPARRRSVLLRDHHRCVVPGCRNSAFVDVHHLQLRSDGGPNHADNLITLCGAHHRAAHRGPLLIDGSPATTLHFRHADGTHYGQTPVPSSVDIQTKVFSALRNLGFRESQVRAALAQLREDNNLTAATTEQWLRAALARLTPRRASL